MIPNPWVLLAALVSLVGAVLGGFAYGKHVENVEWTAKVEKDRGDAEKAARTTEQMWQEVVNGTVKNFEVRVAGVVRERDVALGELRNRPERPADLPEGPRPACQGGTGAELYRADAEFLVREAARADVIRAGLEACYHVIDAARP